MTRTLYIGIDIGMDGGIAFLSQSSLLTTPMPTIKKGKGRDLNLEELAQIVSSANVPTTFVCIEDLGAHFKSSQALRSMAMGYQTFKVMADIFRIPHEFVRAIDWQRKFWTRPKLAKGQKFDTKAAALIAAKRIFPTHDFRKSARCSVPHDGMIDAALIAEYARREGL